MTTIHKKIKKLILRFASESLSGNFQFFTISEESVRSFLHNAVFVHRRWRDLYANTIWDISDFDFVFLRDASDEPQHDKSVRTAVLSIDAHIYLSGEYFFRHTSAAGMNYFSMNGIKQYRVNAKTMFD